MVNCLSGSLVEVWHVVLGESAANPMKTCVLLIVIVFHSVSMKTQSMSKLKQLSLMLWSITFSCSMMLGAQFMVVRLEGKWNLSQITGRVMLLMLVHFFVSRHSSWSLSVRLRFCFVSALFLT